MAENKQIILHVLVIGFHHKKGCQVEFCYPAFETEPSDIHVDGSPQQQAGAERVGVRGNSANNDDNNKTIPIVLPKQWRFLPFIALPDGAHNHTDDSVYFVLPGRSTDNQHTVYGVSCYQLIDAKELLVKDDDVTRGTVQKSVCVISRLPLFGLIEAKVHVITTAYFNQKHFSKYQILMDMYTGLNTSLSADMCNSAEIFVDLSVKDLVLNFKHKVLVLFKLLLLERRVLFFGCPVKHLCTTLLTLLSLYPGMLQNGLREASCSVNQQLPSPEVNLSDLGIDVSDYVDIDQSVLQNNARGSEQLVTSSQESDHHDDDPSQRNLPDLLSDIETQKESDSSISDQEGGAISTFPAIGSVERTDVVMVDTIRIRNGRRKQEKYTEIPVNKYMLDVDDRMCPSLEGVFSDSDSSESGSTSIKHSTTNNTKQTTTTSNNIPTTKTTACDEDMGFELIPEGSSCRNVPTDAYGFPLSLFTKGFLCHPYISLQQHDLLYNINCRGYVVGATNFLLRQKRHITDVVIDLEENKIEIRDNELKKCCNLSTADIRFINYILKTVADSNTDMLLNATGWEGSEEWIRAQFKIYLLSLLTTCKRSDSPRMWHDYNYSYMSAIVTSHSYKTWLRNETADMDDIYVGHPSEGGLSVNDMKLRFHHLMQNTDRGQRLGNAVATTTRVMGAAVSQARSAVSSIWSQISNISQSSVSKPTDNE